MMGREDYISRRQVLVSGLVGTAGGLAGCVSEISDDSEEDADQGESSAGDVPVVDNGSSESEKNVTIDVEVLGEDGEPAAGIEVKLEDRGGTPDNRFGKTGSEGRLRFVESVGPPPCNSLMLLVPEEGLVADLGCHNGPTELEHTFDLSTAETDPAESVNYPVVDNGSSDPRKNVVVDVNAVDEDGEPVPDADVKLEDRGGTPDNRFGQTGSDGRVRFIESVGPPPCNSLTLRMPEAGLGTNLGCHNGDTELEHTFEVGVDESEPPAAVDYPVVDNGNANPERNVVIDLTVVDDSGDPVSGIEVKLLDRGGTPDNRSGQTGSAGRLRFVESVGPPPCNSLSVVVPETGTSMYLGCHDGDKGIQQRLVVER